MTGVGLRGVFHAEILGLNKLSATSLPATERLGGGAMIRSISEETCLDCEEVSILEVA